MTRCLRCDKVIASGSMCADCRTRYETTRAARKQQLRGGSGYQWQRTRERIYARDGGVCQLADDDCDPILSIDDCEIDPIEELADGGTSDDSNLRVLCPTHHRRKTREQAAARRERRR